MYIPIYLLDIFFIHKKNDFNNWQQHIMQLMLPLLMHMVHHVCRDSQFFHLPSRTKRSCSGIPINQRCKKRVCAVLFEVRRSVFEVFFRKSSSIQVENSFGFIFLRIIKISATTCSFGRQRQRSSCLFTEPQASPTYCWQNKWPKTRTVFCSDSVRNMPAS